MTIGTLYFLVGVAVLVSPGVAAQRVDRPQNVNKAELANFDNFLDTHPNIQRDLEQNPNLLNNASYISSHPDLKNFLDSQPAIHVQAATNPRELMSRERKLEKSGRDITKAELADFDSFLDQHSDIEKEVRNKPSLLNNPDYLSKHPELKTFLAAHPSILQEISENPRTFMKAERQYDKKEDKAERREANLESKETRRAPLPSPHPPKPGK